MLCRHCNLMFKNIDQQTKDKENESGFSNFTSLEDLILAAAEECYICSNIYGQLQDENAIERSKTEGHPLLLRRGWRNTSTGEIGATIFRHNAIADPLDDIPVGVMEWQYQLIPASRHKDSFGFEFDSKKHGVTRPAHRSYTKIPDSTHSQEVGALARTWYQRCQNSHKGCRDMQPWILKGTAMSGGVRFGVAEPGGPEIGKWYPPRLLDIASNPIRLVSRRDFKQCPPFAALSHCWGQESFLTLTTDNIESFHKDGFDFAQMPENFQNVVVIVRWLKIRYIWIDSLCIIQSGREAQFDWAEHSDSMQYVYSSCDVCISTAAADAATKSCFKERNTATIAPVCVMVDGEPNILIGKDHAIRGFRNAPIASRAWVLQERLLSRRILTFGPNQVFWECPETAGLNVCETFPGGLVPYGHNRGPFALPPNEPWDRLGEYVDPNTKPSAEDQHIWLDLIETYSECNLTRRHEDKFVAFSGIVMHMHSVFNPSPYIAGFFAFELPAALLWYVRWKAVPRSRPTPPSDFYRAPSWSWAATDSLIRCRRTRILAAQAEPPELVTYFSTLLGHHVQLPHRGMRFGQLSQAALQLKAPLILMTWTGAFPRTEYDQQHTVYEMPDIKYMDIGRAFFFDSEDDFNTPQDGVYFMPILGLENTGQVEGLIVRCTSPPASATVDTAPPPCYIRIGMVVLPADGHFNDVKALETSEFALL